MAEFEVNGVKYSNRKMPPKTQLYVIKRLARFAPVLETIRADSASIESFLGNVGAVSKAIADMPDTDLDFIVDTCLGVCQMYQDEYRRWSQIVAADGTVMFSNLSMLDMVQITYHVLQDQLQDLYGFVKTFALEPVNA